MEFVYFLSPYIVSIESKATFHAELIQVTKKESEIFLQGVEKYGKEAIELELDGRNRKIPLSRFKIVVFRDPILIKNSNLIGTRIYYTDPDIKMRWRYGSYSLFDDILNVLKRKYREETGYVDKDSGRLMVGPEEGEFYEPGADSLNLREIKWA